MANPDSEYDLLVTQVGKESTWGTAVSPTAQLVAIENCEITPLMEATPIPESRGNLVPSYNATIDRRFGEGNISGAITYEDLPYWLDGLLGEATPTGTGPYVYTYNGGLQKPTPRYMTLVRGGPEGVYSIVGCMPNTLEMTFESNAFASFSANLIGKDVESDAIATLADRSFNVVHGNQATVYIDDFGSAAGTTEYEDCSFSASVALDMNRALKSCLGSQAAGGWRQSRGDPGANQLTISLELDSATGASVDIFDEMLAATTAPIKKVVRLKFTLDANHELVIDFAGFISESPTLFGDTDGVATLEFVLNAMYETTLADWLEIVVTNSVSALP